MNPPRTIPQRPYRPPTSPERRRRLEHVLPANFEREKPKAPAKKINRKLLVLLALLGMIGAFSLWQNWPKPSIVPKELIGTWRATDPRYADRSFEIGYVSINFGTGDGNVSTGFINNVEGVREIFRTLYTITYTQDGRQMQVTFYYDMSKNKQIYFKNQPNVLWAKDKDI